jgi:hypothetical protein
MESSVPLIQPGVSKRKIRVIDFSPVGVRLVAYRGASRFQYKWQIFTTGLACSLPTKAHSILGMDYLMNANARLDIENVLELKPYPRPDCRISKKQSTDIKRDQVAFTVFHAQESQTNQRMIYKILNKETSQGKAVVTTSKWNKFTKVRTLVSENHGNSNSTSRKTNSARHAIIEKTTVQTLTGLHWTRSAGPLSILVYAYTIPYYPETVPTVTTATSNGRIYDKWQTTVTLW